MNFEAALKKKFEALAPVFAKEFHALLIKNIKTNKFGYSLSDKTLMQRVRSGNSSDTPLVDSGEYLKNIILRGTKVMVSDGVHPSGISYEELSYVLEYGRLDKSIPAYAVWRKTMKEFKLMLPDIVKRETNKK